MRRERSMLKNCSADELAAAAKVLRCLDEADGLFAQSAFRTISSTDFSKVQQVLSNLALLCYGLAEQRQIAAVITQTNKEFL